MKKYLFMSASDCSDLILYLAKCLSSLDKKVLIVDATECEFFRYAVDPMGILPLFEHDRMDIAVGFATEQAVTDYLREQALDWEDYDYLFVAADHMQFAAADSFHARFLLFDLEKYTLSRNKAAMEAWAASWKDEQALVFHKVFINHVECHIDESYIDAMLEELPISWSEESYTLWMDELDYVVKIQNQYGSRVLIKKLSGPYRRTLHQILQEVCALSPRERKQAWRKARKG